MKTKYIKKIITLCIVSAVLLGIAACGKFQSAIAQNTLVTSSSMSAFF